MRGFAIVPFAAIGGFLVGHGFDMPPDFILLLGFIALAYGISMASTLLEVRTTRRARGRFAAPQQR